MGYRITLIPGDGIGPELAEAALTVLEATGVDFEWERVEAGEAQLAEHGTPLPESVLDSIRSTRVALKGPITTPVGEGFRSVNVTLRQALELYANVRPARSISETAAAESVERAVREVIGEGRSVPRDLGGDAGTRAFAAAVAERVGAVPASR